MKAIRVHAHGGPEVLKLEEVPDLTPGAGQVLLRVKAVGVNPVDTYVRSGNYGTREMPYTPGTDAAGLIERVGSGVKSLKPGDRVYVHNADTGAYAEQIVAAESHAHALPSKLSFAQGAAIGIPYATAYFALVNRGQAQRGEIVLIHGASGGVGTAAIQIARDLGLKVFGTVGTPEGRELVKKEGAHEVFGHRAPDYREQILKKTDNKGVNLILEMLANVNLGHDLKLLAPHGRVAVIGSRGPVEIDPRDMFIKHTDIRGLSLLSVPPDDLMQIHRALGAAFQKGTLKPVIGKEIPLADAAKAHEAVMASGAHGKIVLIP